MRRLAAKRVAKIDQARVGLFDLGPNEVAIEAQAVTATAGWSIRDGMPIDPPALGDLYVAAFPFHSILLVTSTHLRWYPYRTYRGGRVYGASVDDSLARYEPIPKSIYGGFDNPFLGRRSVPIGGVSRVSLDHFSPFEVAIFHVYIDEATSEQFARDHTLLPMYDMRSMIDSRISPPFFPTEALDESTFQFVSLGVAASNFAMLMSKAFDYLVIPFRTEGLDPEDREVWEEAARKPLDLPWEPLSQRIDR